MSQPRIEEQLRELVVYGLSGKVPYKDGIKPGDMVTITGTFRIEYVHHDLTGSEAGVQSVGILKIEEATNG